MEHFCGLAKYFGVAFPWVFSEFFPQKATGDQIGYPAYERLEWS